MAEIPSRAELAALTESVTAIAPSTALGFARTRDDGLISVVYSAVHGFGEFVLPASDVPIVAQPTERGWHELASAALHDNHARAFEGFLVHNGVQRVVSVSLTEGDEPTRFWMGLTTADALTPDAVARLEAVARSAEALLQRRLRPDEAGERLRRLELASRLLPALLHVLDVRQVFDRLSEAAKGALPHDLLLLFLFEEGWSTFRVLSIRPVPTWTGSCPTRIRPIRFASGAFPSSTIISSTRSSASRRPRSWERDHPFASRSASTIA
jgi:hypothetical protein